MRFNVWRKRGYQVFEEISTEVFGRIIRTLARSCLEGVVSIFKIPLSYHEYFVSSNDIYPFQILGQELLNRFPDQNYFTPSGGNSARK